MGRGGNSKVQRKNADDELQGKDSRWEDEGTDGMDRGSNREKSNI